MRPLRLLPLLVASALWPCGASGAPAHAADAPGARPKTCLVLSGGGARGAAHVGVLKVLEELRVPIDCIAGTSMGAIVGAAYASGMSVAELEAQVKALTTEALFNDEPPRNERSMRRKSDDERPYIGPEFGVSVKGGLALPKGAVSGTALEAVLRRLLRTREAASFDELPIPFRAVATDIATGGLVVFKEGDLAAAIRASMSVPGVMAPVDLDGRLLGDGGLVRNLPVDIARGMGAEVVIAVNLGTPLMRRDQLGSALAVSTQMLNILTEQNVGASLKQLGAKDVLISPMLGEASAGDFSGMAKLLPLGEDAARQVEPRLRALALAPAEYAAWAMLRGMRHPSDQHAPSPPPLDEIRVTGTQRVNPEAVRASLRTRTGEPLDQARLDADLRRLYSWGDFERVSYSLSEEDAGTGGQRRVLTLETQEKSWGPDYLRFGLGLQSQFGGSSSFNLLMSLRRTWLNPLGAEWRTDLQLGRDGRLATEWMQPLDTGRHWFLAPQARLTRSPLDLYLGDERVATFENETQAVGLDLGLNTGSTLEWRAGLDLGRRRYSRTTGDASLPASAQVSLGAWRLGLRSDSLDNLQFPREGSRLSAEVLGSLPALGADERYTLWRAEGRQAFSAGAHTLSLSASAGGAIGPRELPIHEYFRLGGPLQLSGYASGRFTGPEYRFARVLYAGRFLKTPLLRGAYAGVSLELAQVGAGNSASPTSGTAKSMGVFTGLDSPLGPLYFGAGFAPGGHRAAYISLGLPN